MADFTSRRGFFWSLASACLASIGLRPQPILAAPPLMPAMAEDVTFSYSYSAAAEDGTFSYSYSASSLPPGISIDPGTRVGTAAIDPRQAATPPRDGDRQQPGQGNTVAPWA